MFKINWANFYIAIGANNLINAGVDILNQIGGGNVHRGSKGDFSNSKLPAFW